MSENSPIINIFAADPVLGKYISHHPSRRLTLLIRAAIFYAIPALIAQFLTLELDDRTASLFLPFLFAGFAAPPIWYVLHFWNREVVLYEKGFSYRRGSITAYFKYADIVKVRQNIETQSVLNIFKRTVYDYELVTDVDEHIKIDNLYSNPEKLTRGLDALITRTRMPLVKEALALGSAVSFGEKLVLRAGGLRFEEREILWQALKTYRIQAGILHLESQDNPEWATLPVQEIDNPVLLIALLKDYLKQQAETLEVES